MTRLSDALRLGATLGRQLRYRLRNNVGDSCAMGAAIIGAGVDGKPELMAQFPVLNEIAYCPTPICPWRPEHPAYISYYSLRVHQIIEHLNDEHLWTREQIAAWLSETYEKNIPPGTEIRDGETSGSESCHDQAVEAA